MVSDWRQKCFVNKADGYRVIEFYEKLDALDDKNALMSIAEICAEGCGKFIVTSK